MVLGAQNLLEDKDDVFALVPREGVRTIAGRLLRDADIVYVACATRDLEEQLGTIIGSTVGL